MGIPYYFYSITKTHKNVLSNALTNEIDVFYLDFNGIIYQSFYKIQERCTAATPIDDIHDLIIQETWAYFKHLVETVRPKEYSMICIDGVAPVAKMVQQRKRRYLSIMRNEQLPVKPIWDTNAISPGTPFMNKLISDMKHRILTDPCGIVRFSGSNENGEGEHKIFEDIRIKCANDKKVLIYGLDADLIMLSIMSHHPNVILMRECQFVQKEKEKEKEKDACAAAAEFAYLNIYNLRQGILRTNRSKYNWAVSESDMENTFSASAKNFLETYVVLCFMLGNDFLPNLPTIHLQQNGLDRLMKCYEGVSGYGELIDHDLQCPNFALIALMFEELSRTEDDHMMHECSDYLKRACRARTEIERIDAYPILPENKDPLAQTLLMNPSKWRMHYYKELFDSKMHDNTVIVSSCYEYITGIMWVFRYYKRLPKNDAWFYPYGYAPTLRDLHNFMLTEQHQFTAIAASWNKLPKAHSFVHPYVQLLTILPVQSIALIPAPLRKMMTDPAMGCSYFYPIRYKIRTFLKTKLHECIPCLPMLNLQTLERAVHT